jgi:protein ImuB
MIVCVLLPRFELAVAVGERRGLLQAPVALAPEPGAVQQVGEVSPAAEAFGIHPGMRLGEALARCPRLTLVPPDPAGAADLWERLLASLEAIGAEVEPERAGLACFEARGLLRLHGQPSPDSRPRGHEPSGSARLYGERGRGSQMPQGDALERLLVATRHALGLPARIGVGPTRFVAVAAATRARVRRPVLVEGSAEQAAAFLAPFPVALLRSRPALAELPDALERLGVRTLGELAALPRAAVADRFGTRGLLARQLSRGEDRPLRPRPPGERLSETLELPESSSGLQLERALELLIDRVLARRERDGRTLRVVVLSAVLVERGGTWRERVCFREALADPRRMRLALVPRLALLPAPAEELRLTVERFGPPAGEQRTLLDDEDAATARRARLREAIRQARAAAGPGAALRVLSLDPDSRLPERRAALTPFEP